MNDSSISESCIMNQEMSDRFSKPMRFIGEYSAIASVFCISLMLADLVNGFRKKKLWFLSKYFSLNATSITLITIALKLSVDLSGAMPTFVDQAAKIGSLGFMCTMMANLMPSLASMDNNTLLVNMDVLPEDPGSKPEILLPTICIQINTGVIYYFIIHGDRYMNFPLVFNVVACIYTALMFLLLLIMLSLSLAIPTCKEILESKYQAIVNNISLADQPQQDMSRVEKLRRHVRRYWVMAETGSPQFAMASNPLSIASGVICAVVLGINLGMLLKLLIIRINNSYYHKLGNSNGFHDYGYSQYKWSTGTIFSIQSNGIIVGSIAPLSRCFSVFSFKNYFMVLKVEKYWTQKLHEWKEIPLRFGKMNRSRSLVYNSKYIVLSLCIGFQKTIVILCKVVWIIVTAVPIFVVRCLTPLITSTTDDIDEDLRCYVLQVDDERELDEKTLKHISKSMMAFISKAEKEQPKNLLELLKKSTGFQGVEIFDTDHVQPLLPVELANTWSLPIVTLACIAVAIPNIRKDIVESLIRSVDEGLSFTRLVEERLNSASEYANIQKATLILWNEIETKCRWLDNPLAKDIFEGKTATEIITWFSDKSTEIVTKISQSTNGEPVGNPSIALISANSMYRITQTLLLRYQSNTEPITKKQLFAHLNRMIADIFCACFTNMPRVIKMRCHESVIEKREASVKVAANLLGKTTMIIERLETREIPSMDDDELAYIDKWRLYLRQSIP